ncbi:MAG TPA: alpha amylase family protein [Armatimonadota bacterium]
MVRSSLLLAGLCLLAAPLIAAPPRIPDAPYQDSVARFTWAREHGFEDRTLWLDATANLERLSTREGVCRVLDKCVDARINTVGVGVKSPCGFVLYKSRIAPRMGRFLDRFTYPADYDLLRTVVEEGHKRGLRVVALVMVFSEGRRVDRSGPAYTRFPGWQSTVYVPTAEGGRLGPQSELDNGHFIFVNPALPAARHYELSVLREIAANYDVDGVAVDRCRYAGAQADFSQASRQAFERAAHLKVARFPGDILTYRWPSKTVVPGRLYRKWIAWRAGVISDFMHRAAATVRSARKGAQFGSVVGAWYPEYASEGANWGSPRFDPAKEWGWATQSYRQTGYADVLDYLTPMCLSPVVTLEEAKAKGRGPVWSVQGGAQMARQAVANACWVYGGVWVKQYEGRPEEFRRALETVSRETNGVRIFDLSQVEEYNWWHIIKEVFKEPAQPPTLRGMRLARELQPSR